MILSILITHQTAWFMFRFFRKKSNGKPPKATALQLVDIEGTPLTPGDLVMSLRYDLGTCRLVEAEHGYAYESVQSGELVSYLRMVDAATTYQKVRKIKEPGHVDAQ
jgi:hypothetical protein